jgi:hypothetical protein
MSFHTILCHLILSYPMLGRLSVSTAAPAAERYCAGPRWRHHGGAAARGPQHRRGHGLSERTRGTRHQVGRWVLQEMNSNWQRDGHFALWILTHNDTFKAAPKLKTTMIKECTFERHGLLSTMPTLHVICTVYTLMHACMHRSLSQSSSSSLSLSLLPLHSLSGECRTSRYCR